MNSVDAGVPSPPDWDFELPRLLGKPSKGIFRPAYFLLATIVIYSVIRGILAAANKPLWLDELLTLTIARQPGVHGVWRAVQSAFDGQPVPFYLIERLALCVPTKVEIALRLPSILAFPCLLGLVFAFAKRSFGELAALMSVGLLLLTDLFDTYLVDARPYSMLMVCIALSLVCYQRMPSRIWKLAFPLALLGAELLHYFAIFAMIPFGIAEIVYSVRRREFRWWIWGSLAFAALPLILFWPVLSTIRATFSEHYFSKPSTRQLLNFYGSYFQMEWRTGAAVLVIAVGALAVFRLRNVAVRREAPVQLLALILSLSVLPFLASPVLKLLHGALRESYVMASTIGVVLAITAGLAVVDKRAVLLVALLVAGIVGSREYAFWRCPESRQLKRVFSAKSVKEIQEIKNFAESSSRTELPVVVSPGMVYPQLVFYCQPQRMVYLTDTKQEIEFEKTDTLVKVLIGFSQFFPMNLRDYSQFTSENRTFLVYSDGSGWVVNALWRDAKSKSLVKVDGGRQLYLVTMK